MNKVKTTPILFLLVLPTILNSIPLNESFTSTTFPPLGWRVINNDGGTKTWERYTTDFYSSPACVSSRYESSTLRNNDWLITPKLKCSETTFDTLRFWYRESGVGNPESLEVWLSTTGNNVNDFTVMLWAKKFTNTSYTLKTISLDSYDGQEIYIAFVNKGLYGFRINLDNITGPEIKEIRDVAVDSIIKPGSSFVMRPWRTGFPPKARIKNYSNMIQRNIPVICSIVGQGSVIHFADVKYLDSLLIDSAKIITFDTFVPVVPELCTIKIRTNLSEDTNSLNDQKFLATQMIKPYFTGGPDAGYSYWIDSDTTTGPIYNWVEISTTGTTLPTGDVNVCGPVPIGFTFNFYGEPMTHFYYSTNGFISFDALSSSYNTNSSTPSQELPNNIIAPFWDDLLTLNAYHQTFGSAPNRYKVIQWRSVIYPGASRDTVIFQIILHENGEIIFQYHRCQNLYNLGLGQSATVGIENRNGSTGLQYLYNGAPQGNLLSAGRAIRFFRYCHDVSVASILIPSQISYYDTIVPKVLIKNLGTNTASFPTFLRIKNDNDDTVYVDSIGIINMAPATACTVNFENWIANQFGQFSVTSWAALDSDYIRSNDTGYKNIVVKLPSPTLLLPTNNFYTNNPNLTFDWTDINNVTRYNFRVLNYLDTILSISECGPISFREGSYYWQVRAGTENYWGDWSDSFKFTVDTTPPPVPILSSPIPNCTLALESPEFIWRRSFGAFEYHLLVIKAEDTLLNILTSDTSHLPNQPLPVARYRWSVRCRDLADNWSDFASFWQFNVQYPIWQRKSDLPDSNSLRPVKDGGCLASNDNKIYALKGNNTQDFYVYDIATNRWHIKSPMPFYIRDSIPIKRKVKAGAALVYANGVIYALKGNNTKEFWKYEPNGDSWTFCQLVPSIKSFKDGSGLTFHNGNVYCLVGGSKELEFLKYDIGQNSWQNLASMPLGIHNRIFKSGSCLVYGGNNKIYCLKGNAKYNEFYCYDIDANAWTEKARLPYLPDGKRYNVKAGAALTYDGRNTIYAIKGNRCQELWAYDILSNQWHFQDTIPKLNKRSLPGNGAGLTFANNRVFIMKGNRTREFWAYIPQNIIKKDFKLKEQDISSSMMELKQSVALQVSSPLTNIRKIIYFSDKKVKTRLNVFEESKIVSIRIYDVQGRLVKSMSELIFHNSSDLELSLDGLPKGIYFLVISR